MQVPTGDSSEGRPGGGRAPRLAQLAWESWRPQPSKEPGAWLLHLWLLMRGRQGLETVSLTLDSPGWREEAQMGKVLPG